ncbi:MAG: hypothetical protein HOM55_09505, partial [Proteobacteria bacterium]|nr:hypothetical protein [Pseudomonadota bacterium]
MTHSQLNRWITALCLALSPVVATAHHSFATTFDVTAVSEYEGEVMSLAWRNPHVLFELKNTDAQGQEVRYQIQSHSLSIMRRMDVSPEALKVGDFVKVAGHPARYAENSMFVLNALLPDGREIVFDQWGKARWGEAIGINPWAATLDDAQDEGTGIFRVWSTSTVGPEAFPFLETMDPAYVENYPLTDMAKAAVAAFNPLTEIPTLNCQPKGMPYAIEQPYPMEIVQLDDEIHIRMEEYNGLRIVHMGEDEMPEGEPLSLMGYSTGHWQDDTLVIETSRIGYGHFSGGGIPLSDDVLVVEQFVPSEDGKSMRLNMTVTDPSSFTEPVELTKVWLALPGATVEDF